MNTRLFYTASKTEHAHMWQKLRDSEGYLVTSTWIDQTGDDEPDDYSELAERCVRDIVAADFLLLYVELGEIHKGSLMEVGIALAHGKEIRCVGWCDSFGRVFHHHPLWKRYDTVDDAING